MEFIEYKKIPRLFRECVITEKLDGTNGCIRIAENEFAVQARKKFITPDDDVHGLAAWAYSVKDELIEELGAGTWFGEWFGYRINRGYSLDRKWFALFHRNHRGHEWTYNTPGLTAVPVLAEAPFNDAVVQTCLESLRCFGSWMVSGYMNPEGVVISHSASGSQFKVTLDGDGVPKSER